MPLRSTLFVGPTEAAQSKAQVLERMGRHEMAG
jgi:hypothetical protein